MHYFSKAIDQAVKEIGLLPGIGERTALRLVLHLLKQKKDRVSSLSESIIALKNNVHFCTQCGNVSEDKDRCIICYSPVRDQKIICIVEEFKDIIAIENTKQFNGLYHVLGGKISPMNGVMPEDLTMDLLLDRLTKGGISEVVFALSQTVDGDTTSAYIYRNCTNESIKFYTLARGISVGNELEYTDLATLARSFMHRVEYTKNMVG